MQRAQITKAGRTTGDQYRFSGQVGVFLRGDRLTSSQRDTRCRARSKHLAAIQFGVGHRLCSFIAIARPNIT